MKILQWLGILCFFALSVAAWTKEDHEIFDLVSALEAAEGKDTTFYSWLEVSSSASSSEIGRAYRKKSVLLHPDKNPGVKGAHERFARLGVIAKILRDKEGRKRYDFFHKNGVPRWRGTGYYYSRYRPGLGSALAFVIALTSCLHYMVQRMNYKTDLARIDRFVREARLAAWGPKLIPVEGRRKVKVNLGGRSYIDEEGNVISGRQLDMVVEGNDVFIAEPNGELLSLDDSAASPPAFHRTWFIALVLLAYHKLRGTKHVIEEQTVDEGDSVSSRSSTPQENRKQRRAKKVTKKAPDVDSEESSRESPGLTNTTTTAMSKTGTRGPTSMAGGRRRKATPRKRPEKPTAEPEGTKDP